MKQLFSKTLMLLVGVAFVLPTQAQLLRVIVPDKALQAQTAIPWQKALVFDNKGVAILENPEITERKELIVELEERKEFFFAIVEPGLFRRTRGRIYFCYIYFCFLTQSRKVAENAENNCSQRTPRLSVSALKHHA